MSTTGFAKEIRRYHGGETITLCYQCGTCASSCPVYKTSNRFNPREIIRLAILDNRKEVLNGDAIWLCASCYNCQERCPQKVEIAEIMFVLRNMAIREGNFPKVYEEFANALITNGRLAPISKFIEKKRTEYGLPPVKPAGIEAVNKILSATGLLELVSRKGESP
ncbi:4Fe-4S dicluster domain-containing protein [Candidatus Bathyarchaeota archaeon]|nr:4Fe-4S dicluster domain-containing protein [Candidatus Bathyarchaeota archaeon]